MLGAQFILGFFFDFEGILWRILNSFHDSNEEPMVSPPMKIGEGRQNKHDKRGKDSYDKHLTPRPPLITGSG